MKQVCAFKSTRATFTEVSFVRSQVLLCYYEGYSSFASNRWSVYVCLITEYFNSGVATYWSLPSQLNYLGLFGFSFVKEKIIYIYVIYLMY